MNNLKAIIAIFTSTILLHGCGGSGGSSSTDSSADSLLTLAKLGSVKIVDAQRKPAAGSYLSLATSLNPGSSKTLSAAFAPSATALQADANGVVDIPDLDPGTYTLTITSDDELVDSVIKLKVGSDNRNKIIEIMAPLAKSAAGAWSNITNTATIGNVSGSVSDGTSPIANAEVSLSGGAATNGAVTKVFTDAAGQFNLNINVGKKFTAAMLNTSITIRAEGFNTEIVSGFQLLNSTALSGLNFVLTSGTNGTGNAVFQETFEADSTTLAGWTINKLSGDNTDTNWNIYSIGSDIVNQAFTDGFVQLAPNDLSEGLLLNPIQGSNAFWYGSQTVADGSLITGSVQGNFLDNQDTFDPFPLDGGFSVSDNSGELISPLIDLSTVATSTPLSLTFKTWWEIESVNPNSSGFDLMTVELSTDGGSTFTPISRLNPLSDPQSISGDNSPIPFSNTGYNNAPAWAQQENIPLDGAQGQTIQLKFTFATVDSLFNGFRGWMIDDLQIQDIAGTAALFNETGFDNSFAFDDAYVYVAYSDSDFLPVLTPQPYDASGFLTPLTVGSTQSISTTLNYSSTTSGTMKLVFHVYDFTDFSTTTLGAGTTFAETAFTSTGAGLESAITLSGSAVVPASPDGFVELWVQMFDDTGSLIVEMPIEFYEVL